VISSVVNADRTIGHPVNRKVLTYGEKIAKIGPVSLEIFNEIRQFFGRVVHDVHK